MTESALVHSSVAEEYGTGLEDLDPNEIQVPRIKIDHPNGIFVDSLTGEEFPQLSGVFLGMIKQRTMWRRDYNGEADARPQCKSNDAATGYPNTDSSNEDDHFPWSDAGPVDRSKLDRDEHGRLMISCEVCPFSKWTGTRQKPKVPRCSELHTYPVMYSSEDGGEIDRAGIVTFKGSGIKPSKAFLKGFAAAKRPVYTSTVRVTLKQEQNGMIRYSVPVFAKGGAVDEEDWRAYGEELKGLREILREPPRIYVEESTSPGAAATIPAPTQTAYMPAQRQPGAPSEPTSNQNLGSIVNQASGPVAPTPFEEELPF